MSDLEHIGDLPDYEIEIRIRNARILGLMRRAGIANINQLAKKSGVGATDLGLLVNLKVTPLMKTSPDYRPQVWRIAEALNCHPDDMFSDRQRTTYLATNRKAIEVSEAEVESHLAALEQASPDKVIELAEQKTLLREAMAKLNSREQKVLEMRYGLDGGPERTLDEVAEVTGIGRARVGQLEARALRALSKVKAIAATVDFQTKKIKMTNGLSFYVASSRKDIRDYHY